jgi:hypothetical protein
MGYTTTNIAREKKVRHHQYLPPAMDSFHQIVEAHEGIYSFDVDDDSGIIKVRIQVRMRICE